MSESVVIRQATVEDADVIARHRALMFTEMHEVIPARAAELTEKTGRYLQVAIPSGEYVGWLAHESAAPGAILAGAGIQLRKTLLEMRFTGTLGATPAGLGTGGRT